MAAYKRYRIRRTCFILNLMHVVDRVGSRYGKLTVLSRAHSRPGQQRAFWNCLCDCGGQAVVSGHNLATGNTKACGCKKRKHHFDEGFFDSIDSEDKAYILGLIYADGCLSPRGERRGSVRLSQIDKELMVKVAVAFGLGEQALYCIHPSEKRGYKNSKIQYSLELQGGPLYQRLIELGCTPRKSLTCGHPPDGAIPPDLIRHFIRGYFDGDGCINVFNKFYKRVCIVGTMDTLAWIGKNLPFFYSLPPHRTTDGMFYLTFGAVSSIEWFRDYLYTDAEVFSRKKRNKFFLSLPPKPVSSRALSARDKEQRVIAALMASDDPASAWAVAGVSRSFAFKVRKRLAANLPTRPSH